MTNCSPIQIWKRMHTRDMLDALLFAWKYFLRGSVFMVTQGGGLPNSCTCVACNAAANISVSFVIADQVALTWWGMRPAADSTLHCVWPLFLCASLL